MVPVAVINGCPVRDVLEMDCQLIAVEGYANSAKMLAEKVVCDRVDTALLQEWVSRTWTTTPQQYWEMSLNI